MHTLYLFPNLPGPSIKGPSSLLTGLTRFTTSPCNSCEPMSRGSAYNKTLYVEHSEA
jgi:hypothetical protein